MSEHAIQFSGGIPTTVLPDPPDALVAALREATNAHDRRDAKATVVSRFPDQMLAWAEYGDAGRDTVERYAAYRVGYHRGLDALRANGWRGSGYVRWSAPSNAGFLRCLVGLQQAAAAIGEHHEAERVSQFLLQLDPTGVPVAVAAALPPFASVER